MREFSAKRTRRLFKAEVAALEKLLSTLRNQSNQVFIFRPHNFYLFLCLCQLYNGDTPEAFGNYLGLVFISPLDGQDYFWLY